MGRDAATMWPMADQQHTGGMIALIPADPSTLAVPGGDPDHELHMTLAYLGDDMSILNDEHRAALHELLRKIADPPPPFNPNEPDYASRGPAFGNIWAHAVFNPGPDAATVYLVGEIEPEYDVPIDPGRQWLNALADRACYGARGILGVLMPKQHHPWQPHVTAGYGLDPALLSVTGRVVFDRIRLALAGNVTDYRLVPGPELKAQSPDPRARRLAKWWARDPKGRARWMPGTPGDYNRLRAALRKEIGPDMPQRVLDGLAANIHKMATGEWPGPKAHGGKKSANEEKAVATMDDDELLAKLDGYAAMADDLTVVESEADAEPGDNGEASESMEEVYEDAVESDSDLTLEADGTLTEGESELSDTETEEDQEVDEEQLVAELAALFADAEEVTA